MTTTSTFAMLRKLSLITAVLLIVAACGAAADSGDDGRTPSQIDADTAVATTAAAEPGGDEAEHEDAAAHDDEAGHDDEAAHDADRVVEVSMTDLAFTPSSVQVVAGETITFVVGNDGAIVHEFRLSNAHRIEEHLASGHEDHDEGGGHHGDADAVLQLEAGETGEITVTVPEDVTFFTEIACLIPGHYEAGMKGVVTYQ